MPRCRWIPVTWSFWRCRPGWRRNWCPIWSCPTEFRAIVNAHFHFAPPEGAPPILGVIGGTAEWIFSFDDRISVTVSGADAIVDRDREDLARVLWRDVCAALRISAELPPWQIVKEKRATFAATPAQDIKRPPAKTPWRNLMLAGDWTDTGPSRHPGRRRAVRRGGGGFGAQAPGFIVAGDEPACPSAISPKWKAPSAPPPTRSWREQRPDGHWVYELEADATIPAEYVLLVHYLAEAPNLELERKIGVYLRRIQGAHGGWPLYHEGAFDISATVKAYFALKMIGDDIEAPHMVARARGDPGAGRRDQGQCLHPHPAGAVWPNRLGQRADRAGGTDPACRAGFPSICRR